MLRVPETESDKKNDENEDEEYIGDDISEVEGFNLNKKKS